MVVCRGMRMQTYCAVPCAHSCLPSPRVCTLLASCTAHCWPFLLASSVANAMQWHAACSCHLVCHALTPQTLHAMWVGGFPAVFLPLELEVLLNGMEVPLKLNGMPMVPAAFLGTGRLPDRVLLSHRVLLWWQVVCGNTPQEWTVVMLQECTVVMLQGAQIGAPA